MTTIHEAIKIINQGGIGIFPTDTAYGIGCRMDNKEAVKRLFRVRRRSIDKATPVLVSSIEMAQKYLEPIPEKVKTQLINKYWPGALTIVLPCKTEKILSLVRGEGSTLGVRMPDHNITLSLINGVNVPLLGPSANFAGEKTPFTYEDVDKELIKLVDFVIEGKTKGKKASTVIDCSISPWKILRKGAIKITV